MQKFDKDSWATEWVACKLNADKEVIDSYWADTEEEAFKAAAEWMIYGAHSVKIGLSEKVIQGRPGGFPGVFIVTGYNDDEFFWEIKTTQ